MDDVDVATTSRDDAPRGGRPVDGPSRPARDDVDAGSAPASEADPDPATDRPDSPPAAADPTGDAPTSGSRRRRWGRHQRTEDVDDQAAQERTRVVEPVDLPPNDPLRVLLASSRRPVLVDDLDLDSPAVTHLREAGIHLLVPLVANGELVGVIQLGERLSEQAYTADDRRLLDQLAGQAAPALRLGQLVKEQEAEIRRRERYEQELQVAQLIQQRFLPSDLPEPAGWRIHPYYRAAREVGGDFYDVLDLPDGRLGLVIGDVTDKGVPAALVMASTRSVLRAAAQRLVDPAEVLARVNDELVRDIPGRMFVTCLYGVLDPETGVLEFANAGHDLPFVVHDGVVTEAHATGMPLGMLPGSTYDNTVLHLQPGSRLLLYSDGIAEAHAPDGEMFGFGRTGGLLVDLPDGRDGVDAILDRLAAFTGPDWEQEDDVTMLLVDRADDQHFAAAGGAVAERATADGAVAGATTSFRLASRPGGEREAIERVEAALADVDLPDDRRQALSTAVGEAVMNAMEHAHGHDESLEVQVDVAVSDERVTVAVTDRGAGGDVLDAAVSPDLDAKLRGEQSPRGWGLFLVRSLVDDVTETTHDGGHTLAMELRLEGGAS